MERLYTNSSTSRNIASSTVSKDETIPNFQKALWDIKKHIHEHVESKTPLQYLDAIKDALHTLNMLERRLNALQKQSNNHNNVKSETATTFELGSFSREINLLKTTVKSITENHG